MPENDKLKALMPSNWNRGLTKETNDSLRKTSETMKQRKIDNFSQWRKKKFADGTLKSEYPEFTKNGDLAELMGVMLGDGHIQKFPRTERLLIFSNAANKGFVKRYAKLVETIFQKKPYVFKQTGENCIRISLYEKHISRRLRVPTGARKELKIVTPSWILKNKGYMVRYLRGLYEAEGSFCVHEPTYTHKFLFANTNVSLLAIVHLMMSKLGFSPHKGTNQVQISKKREVYEAMKVLQFRKYE